MLPEHFFRSIEALNRRWCRIEIFILASQQARGTVGPSEVLGHSRQKGAPICCS